MEGTGAFEWISGTFQKGMSWIAEKFNLNPQEQEVVDKKLEGVAEDSKEKRMNILDQVLGRGWLLAKDGLKILAHGNGVSSDITVLAEQLFEKPENKSIFDNLKIGYFIIEKIPFLGKFVEKRIAQLPYFMEVAQVVDPTLAEKIKGGDMEAVSLMVQKILAMLDLVRDQVAYTDKKSETKTPSDTTESTEEKKEGIFSSMLSRAWMACADTFKIWAQNTEWGGDAVTALEQLTESDDKKTIVDKLKLVYMILEKVPLVGGAIERIIPNLPYFQDMAEKIDPALAEKMKNGDGEATSQLVQKLLGYMELVINQTK